MYNIPVGKRRKNLQALLSELFVNLASGFFGAAIVVPIFSQDSLGLNFIALTLDLAMGIFFLVLAFRLKV